MAMNELSSQEVVFGFKGVISKRFFWSGLGFLLSSNLIYLKTTNEAFLVVPMIGLVFFVLSMLTHEKRALSFGGDFFTIHGLFGDQRFPIGEVKDIVYEGGKLRVFMGSSRMQKAIDLRDCGMGEYDSLPNLRKLFRLPCSAA